jgi:hypothetical protein
MRGSSAALLILPGDLSTSKIHRVNHWKACDCLIDKFKKQNGVSEFAPLLKSAVSEPEKIMTAPVLCAHRLVVVVGRPKVFNGNLFGSPLLDDLQEVVSTMGRRLMLLGRTRH